MYKRSKKNLRLTTIPERARRPTETLALALKQFYTNQNGVQIQMIRIIVGLCWLFLLTSAASAQELKRVKIGYPAISYNQIHIWVAKEAGLFKKYGLDAEIIFFRGGQTATQALVAGDPPIVNIGTVVQAGLQGHDVVLIASSENTYNYSVVARPSITKIEQLKGNRLGVSGFVMLGRATTE